ncbi:MAG: RNA polymerase sigma factor [Ilumatobacteraceae bacterium]
MTAPTNSVDQPDTTAPDPVWAETYREEGPRLIRLATVLVGPADAQDLVADTVHALVRRDDWSSISEPSAYLTRSVVNAAIALKRSTGRRLAREERSVRLTIAHSVDPAHAIDVQRALRRLSLQQRAVAYFVYWEDLTIPQIARRLDVTEGTVRKQLARAKERLREVLR